MCFESYIQPGCYSKFLKWLVYIEMNNAPKESNRTSNQKCSRKLCYHDGNNKNNGKDRYNNKYNNDLRINTHPNITL